MTTAWNDFTEEEGLFQLNSEMSLPKYSWEMQKYLKDNKHNSLYLARKYAWIFVLGHYLFREAHSFSGATLSENCSLLVTDNVHGQISKRIFSHQIEAIVYLN